MVAGKVAIILVKYNQPEMEANTIRHVLDTVQHPNWTLVAHQNERGVGLAACWNRLIAAQDAEYIVLLDTDTVPARSWLDQLLAALDAGLPAAVPSSNRVHLAEVDTSGTWAPDVTPALDTIDLFARKLERQYAAQPTYVELPTASSMCVAFPKSTWEAVGGFNEEFKIWGADTEFFYRVAKKLGPIAWIQGAYVHHYQHGSTGRAVQDGEFDLIAERTAAQKLWEKRQAEIDAE